MTETPTTDAALSDARVALMFLADADTEKLTIPHQFNLHPHTAKLELTWHGQDADASDVIPWLTQFGIAAASGKLSEHRSYREWTGQFGTLKLLLTAFYNLNREVAW